LAEIIAGLLTATLQGAKEALAIVSNVTAFYAFVMAVINLLQLVSSQGIISGTISWIFISAVTSFVTGLIAEALSSAIPSPLRWIAKNC
jgi:hypothetical protein